MRNLLSRDRYRVSVTSWLVAAVALLVAFSATFLLQKTLNRETRHPSIPQVLSFRNDQYACTTFANRTDVGPLEAVPDSSPRMYLEWAARPRGRPIAVYFNRLGRRGLTVCPEIHVNLQQNPISLGPGRGPAPLHSRIESSTISRNGTLSATLVVASHSRVPPPRVPLARITCGTRSVLAWTHIARITRSWPATRLRVKGVWPSRACLGERRLVVAYRIEENSLYLLAGGSA